MDGCKPVMVVGLVVLASLLVFVLMYACIYTMFMAFTIEKIQMELPFVNAIPMVEWFLNIGGDRVLSVTDVNFEILGYRGLWGFIEGQPAAGVIKYFFGRDPNYFGGKYHTGVDISCVTGTQVRNVMSGKVTHAGYSDAGYGYLVVVENNGVQQFYGHLSHIDVEVGDVISKGDQVGLSGNTGFSTGPHLHWEIRVDGIPVDPLSEQWKERSGESVND